MIQTPESCDLRSNTFFATKGLAKVEDHLKTWQGKNQEKGSICADPLFVKALDFDKEIKPSDIQFKATSPVFKTGFKAIDTSKIGLRNEFPIRFLKEVFPSKRGRLISRDADISYSSIRSQGSDLKPIVNSAQEISKSTIFESKPEKTPWMILKLKESHVINGIHVIANANDRQNALRALTVWSSMDGKNWKELWHTDPYHIGIGREFHIKPWSLHQAKYLKVGLKAKQTLQMSDKDDRMRSIRNYSLSIKHIKVFSAQ